MKKQSFRFWKNNLVKNFGWTTLWLFIFLMVQVSAAKALPSLFEYGNAFQFGTSEWSEPVIIEGVNSSGNETNAFLSKDKLSLYFSSNRAGGYGGVDIYVAQRSSVDSPWQTPVNLGSPINTSNDDLAPNISIDGHLLFFNSNRPGGEGGTDIYVSWRSNTQDDFAWEDPENVGTPINTAAPEGAPFYLQNAEIGAGNLYFVRGLASLQQSDLYYASVTRKGEAQGDVVFVTELNTTANDGTASLSHDGREIYFTSTRPGSLGSFDIWTSTRQNIYEPWSTPVNAGATINSVFVDTTPTLSFDGKTLIFASNRPGVGGSDLWMTTR